MTQINWELFTREEKDKINKLMAIGYYQGVALMPDLATMSPAKELELQKIVDMLRPDAEDFISKLKPKFEKQYPQGAQNPEVEVEIQAALEKEYSDYLVNKEKKEIKRRKAMGSIEEIDEVEIQEKVAKKTKKPIKKAK